MFVSGTVEEQLEGKLGAKRQIFIVATERVAVIQPLASEIISKMRGIATT